MSDPSDDLSRPAMPPADRLDERFWRLVTILLATALALALLACLIVLIEGGLLLILPRIVDSPGKFSYWINRLLCYALLAVPAGLAIRRFTSPQRRLRWWIGLAIACVLLITPATSVYIVFLIVLFAMRVIG